MTVKLIQGDCLEEMLKLANDGVKVDLVLTDLPYGTTNCKWDNVIPFEPMWECLNGLTYENTPIVLFGSQPFTTNLINSNFDLFKYELIWDKVQGKQPYLAKIQPMKSHENILVFGKGKLCYNPQMRKGKPYKDNRGGSSVSSEHYPNMKRSSQNNLGVRYPVSIIQCNNPNHKGMHPTQKPTALLEYLIKTYTNEEDLVLDFTMGSGSTGVACVNTNRNFIGIELDENYYKIAQERINETKKQTKLM